jgi:Spy/CpxP family protein refolding chaperone
MDAFAAEFRKEKIDEAVLNAGADEIAQRHEQMRSAMKSTIKELHAILTPEQRAKASEKLAQLAERAPLMHGKHGRHHGKSPIDLE